MVYKTPVVTDEQYMLSAIVSYVLPVVVDGGRHWPSSPLYV